MWSVSHEDAMKVQRRRLVAERVECIHNQAVPDVDVYDRGRPLSIDAYCRSGYHAVRVGSDPCDVEVVCHRGGLC